MSESIGFIGLGQMGIPMATNLIKAGFSLRVYNRTPDKAAPLTALGAKQVFRPCDAVQPGGIVITMLSNDEALEDVVLGDNGILNILDSKGVHLSMSTVSPAVSRKFATLHGRRGSMYIGAPVFGRPEAAAARKLWIAVSGAAAGKERAQPILQALGQGTFDFGENAVAAHVVKLAGNFLIVSALEALAEALALAEKNKVDRNKVAEMLGQTIFACPIYQNYGKAIANQVYEPAGFKLSLGLKDVSLALDAAAHAKVPMPLGSLLYDRLLTSAAKGREEMDWTALAWSVSEDAGLR